MAVCQHQPRLPHVQPHGVVRKLRRIAAAQGVAIVFALHANALVGGQQGEVQAAFACRAAFAQKLHVGIGLNGLHGNRLVGIHVAHGLPQCQRHQQRGGQRKQAGKPKSRQREYQCGQFFLALRHALAVLAVVLGQQGHGVRSDKVQAAFEWVKSSLHNSSFQFNISLLRPPPILQAGRRAACGVFLLRVSATTRPASPPPAQSAKAQSGTVCCL